MGHKTVGEHNMMIMWNLLILVFGTFDWCHGKIFENFLVGKKKDKNGHLHVVYDITFRV